MAPSSHPYQRTRLVAGRPTSSSSTSLLFPSLFSFPASTNPPTTQFHHYRTSSASQVPSSLADSPVGLKGPSWFEDQIQLRPVLPPPSASIPLPFTSSTSSLDAVPSPLVFQPLTVPPLVDEDWDARNPFSSSTSLSSKFEPPRRSSKSRTATNGMVISSSEETRTSQACQACRARKSKCDGKPSCARCEKRGHPCVYIPRPARLRNERPSSLSRSSASSTSSLVSYANSITDHPPSFTATSLPKFESDRGGGSSQSTQSSMEGWGGEIQGWRDQVGSMIRIGGRDRVVSRRNGGLGSGLSSHEEDEESRRRRPFRNPYPSSPYSLFPTKSSSTASISSFLQPAPQPTLQYPNSNYNQLLQPPPPPPPLQERRQQLLLADQHFQPHPPPLSYPPPSTSSINQADSTFSDHLQRSQDLEYQQREASSLPFPRDLNDYPQQYYHPNSADVFTSDSRRASWVSHSGMSPELEDPWSPSSPSSSFGGVSGWAPCEDKWAEMGYSG